jgi:hypothetical protein
MSMSTSADPGELYKNPSWFSPLIFPGAKILQQSRTERDEQGFYTSQFLFELNESFTEEQCVERLTKIHTTDIPDVKAAKQASRTVLNGQNAYYKVTHVCGTAPDGKIRALVSFRWTAAPDELMPSTPPLPPTPAAPAAPATPPTPAQ